MTSKFRGFTLIEVLVVMSLLSLIMVAMGSALRTMSQTEIRIDERLQRTDQMRVANNLLQAILGRVDVNQGGDAKIRSVLFAADASSISWVGVMPARHGVGGRYFFHLAIEEVDLLKALVLRYSTWSMQTAFPDWSKSESYVLATDITEFQVEAEGLPANFQEMSPAWPLGWQIGWPVKDALPQRLRLTWSDRKGTWPPLAIALVPLRQNMSKSSGFVIGGSE